MQKDYDKLFPDERENYKNDLEGVHYILLRMLKILKCICEKYNISYWLDAGTLLGAHRHGGFIPWDDDIDIIMPRKDYNKFIKVFLKENPKDIFLQSKETDKFYNQDFLKLRDLKSLIIEKNEIGKKINYKNGIFLDIFPVDDVKELKFFKKLGIKINKFAYLPSYINSNASISLKILSEISKLIGRNNILKLNEALYKLIKNFKNRDAYIYMEGKQWWNTWNKNEIYPLRNIKFNDELFLAPRNITYYLNELYGEDFMELPPKNKRYNHLSKIILDTNKYCPKN